jgi:toxin ParE1/3/4
MKTYDLSLAAEGDLRDIWRYTYGTWGIEQAERYFDQIEACCDVLGDGRSRSKSFDKLPDDIRVHRCEHHYIFWLVGDRPIIVAILHERMDFLHRLKDRL